MLDVSFLALLYDMYQANMGHYHVSDAAGAAGGRTTIQYVHVRTGTNACKAFYAKKLHVGYVPHSINSLHSIWKFNQGLSRFVVNVETTSTTNKIRSVKRRRRKKERKKERKKGGRKKRRRQRTSKCHSHRWGEVSASRLLCGRGVHRPRDSFLSDGAVARPDATVAGRRRAVGRRRR